MAVRQSARIAFALVCTSCCCLACSAGVPGPNRAPVARAGKDIAIALGTTATLDGAASHDPDGDELRFVWDLVAAPAGGEAELAGQEGTSIYLTPDVPGAWMIRLVVSDGEVFSRPDVVMIHVRSDACERDDQCDDGAFCNGVETCDGLGACRPGTDPCAPRSCDEANDACVDCLDDFDCGPCEKCVSGGCVHQDAGEDLKDACDPDDCHPGACDGNGACGLKPAGTPCAAVADDYCSGTCDDAAICDPAAPVDCSLDDVCHHGVCDPADGHCEQVPNVEGPGDPGSCSDGFDNDCDGMTDGADRGCGTWWNTAWTRRRKLTFDNTAQGENLTDFPVLVALTDQDRIDYDHTLDAGEDIRFVDADDTTRLAHEIEVWNEDGTSVVWVEVPRIDGGVDTDFIWMYYDNTVATDDQDAPGVWSNHYQAVYHLHDDLDDSSGSGYHGTNQGSFDAQGRIGDGQEFDGDDAIILGYDLPLLVSVEACTLSAWVWPDVIDEKKIVLGVARNNGGTPTDSSRAEIGMIDGDEMLAAGRSSDSEDLRQLTTNTGPVPAGDWYYLAGVIDFAGDRITAYVDGNQEGSGSFDFQPATPGTNAENAAIGSQDHGSGRHVDGVIDEVRVADTARSADWIRAQHLSMTDAFVTYGGEQSRRVE